MTVLSKESFESISYLIQNQSYANIVARLEVDLSPIDSHFFSRFRQEGGYGTWYTDDVGPFKPFKEASPQEQELIAIEMEARKESINDKMQAKMPYVNSLFSIPSDNQIFFRFDESGDIRVTLAQWGFKANGGDSSVDILSAIIARPRTLTQTDVWIQVLYSDGLPAIDSSFNLHLFNALNELIFKTDAEGKFHLGNVINGKDFSVNDGAGHNEHFIVTQGQSLYVVNLPLYTSFEIVVQNQEGTRKPNYSLMLDDSAYVTNDNGVIVVEQVLLTPDKQIEARNNDNVSQSYPIAREGNHFLFEVIDHFVSSLSVIVRYDDGELIPERKIRIGKAEYVTDADGKVIVSDLDPDSTIHVQDLENSSVIVDKQLERGDNTVELVIEKPTPPMVRVRVFDVNKKPIINTLLRFETKLGPLEAVTDRNGAVFFPKEVFTHKEKVRLRFEYVDSKDKKKIFAEESSQQD